MALTAGSLKALRGDRDWNLYKIRFNSLVDENSKMLREKDELRMRVQELESKLCSMQTVMNTECNSLENELRIALRDRDAYKQENAKLKRELEECKISMLPAVSEPIVSEKKHSKEPVVSEPVMSEKKHRKKPVVSDPIVSERKHSKEPVVSEPVMSEKKHRKKRSSKSGMPRVYDASKEEDIEFIFGTCWQGVAKCMPSDAYVNKHYTQIVRNNGFHNGISNACLAISLSDGLSRIINGRPANSQETEEMMKSIGCKGRMLDMMDINVVVGIFNKICAPHAINIHIFKRTPTGTHTHYQTISHSPSASKKDRCIVLSWVEDTHFELMLRP